MNGVIPKLTIKTYPKEIHPFIIFIRKLYRINKWVDLKKLEISFDYQAKDVAGFYDPKCKHKIYINPSNCINRVANTEFSQPIILIHEFCHLIDSHLNIFETWANTFQPIYLNPNSKRDRIEELAELLTVYLLDARIFRNNISKPMHKFFKQYLKAPNKSNIVLPEAFKKHISD
jgi:hypothetical protein